MVEQGIANEFCLNLEKVNNESHNVLILYNEFYKLSSYVELSSLNKVEELSNKILNEINLTINFIRKLNNEIQDPFTIFNNGSDSLSSENLDGLILSINAYHSNINKLCQAGLIYKTRISNYRINRQSGLENISLLQNDLEHHFICIGDFVDQLESYSICLSKIELSLQMKDDWSGKKLKQWNSAYSSSSSASSGTNTSSSREATWKEFKRRSLKVDIEKQANKNKRRWYIIGFVCSLLAVLIFVAIICVYFLVLNK